MKLTIVDECAGDIILNWRWNCRIEPIRIHHAQHGIVLCSSWMSFEQHSIPLAVGNVQIANFLGLGVDAISLDDGEIVLINMEVILSKARNVDDPEEVRLACLYLHARVSSVIHQRGLRNWLRATPWVQGDLCRNTSGGS